MCPPCKWGNLSLKGEVSLQEGLKLGSAWTADPEVASWTFDCIVTLRQIQKRLVCLGPHWESMGNSGNATISIFKGPKSCLSSSHPIFPAAGGYEDS